MENYSLENNKMIAEFMGLVIITDNISYFDTDYKPLKKYHSDWSWLMPVVEKIIGMKDVYGQKRHEVKMSINPKIDITYGAVVEFIKWYNETSK